MDIDFRLLQIKEFKSLKFLVLTILFSLTIEAHAQRAFDTPIDARWAPMSWEKLLPSERGSYPYRAVVQLAVKDGNRISHCHATFVSPTELITSAHCGYGDSGVLRNTTDFTIHLWPEASRLTGESSYQVIGVSVHQKYRENDSSTRAYDIMMLKIDKPIGQKLGYFALHRTSGDLGRAFSGTLTSTSVNVMSKYCKSRGVEHVVQRPQAYRDVVNLLAFIRQDAGEDYIDHDAVKVSDVCSIHTYISEEDNNNAGNRLISDKVFATTCGLGGIHNGYIPSNCPIDDGDSGGPIFILENNFPTIVAVHSGAVYNEGYEWGQHNHTKEAYVHGGPPEFIDYSKETPSSIRTISLPTASGK